MGAIPETLFEFEPLVPAGQQELIKEAVRVCKQKVRYSGICGQGPSDFPDFAEFLVDLGIDSLSLNPDSVIRTTLMILEKEKSKKIIQSTKYN